MTNEERAALAEQADHLTRAALDMVAAENETAALSARAVSAGLIQAAAVVMAQQGIRAADIAEHFRTIARSVEAQAGILRNLQ